MARSLGSYHPDIHVAGRDYGLVVDGETVSKSNALSGAEVWLYVALVDLALRGVGEQHDYNVRLFGGF